MSTYTPDRWVVIKLTRGSEVIYKVLAGWYGGYLSGDSWQLNSGIVKVVDTGNTYEFHGYSGSVYTCYKGREGTSGIMRDIFNNLESQTSGIPGYSVEICTDWVAQFEMEYN